MNLSIDKKILVNHVYKSLKRKINKQHILSITSILFEEMIKDLLLGKKITITNFGDFETIDTKPRRHMNVVSKEISVSSGSTILKLILSKKLSKFLKNKLDIDKTFGETHNGKT